MSYIFITHDLATVKAIAHRIYVLKDGAVVEEGATKEIFSKPAHAYTKTLVEAAL